MATRMPLLARAALGLINHVLYDITPRGAEHIPPEGPALLVANHVSFADGFLVAAGAGRMIRFLMYKPYYEHWAMHWLLKRMGVIPISDEDSPKDILKSLRGAREALLAGDAVCIFAEGEITRTGNMLRFKRGFEKIAHGLDVPVVPVHLDRVWGSIFSFEGGRFIWKMPRRFPYPVTVSFGPPLPHGAGAPEVRRAIQELGSDAFRHRLEDRAPLPIEFLRSARRGWFRFAAADSLGLSFTYGRLFAAAWLLSRKLAREAPESAAAVLLPPSVPAVLANLALALAGKVPVNLNYTLPREAALDCARRAGARKVVTSRRFLERLGWTVPDALFLEDLKPRLSRLKGALLYALAPLLPGALLERLLLPRFRAALDDVATIVFTSGTTGTPKGVPLTHANLLSNIEGLAQVFAVEPSDRILGILPFFHSFGLTATVWFPLVSGMGTAYHVNPLDARTVGELAERFRATLLLATPSFLQAYLRRIPPERFKSLKYAVAGAEKLRPGLAEEFERTFGFPVLEGYGATELSPVGAVNVPDFRRPGVRQRGRKPGKIGHPLPGVTMKVVDPEGGGELPTGRPGLLLVKGPNVMKGYLDDEAATKAVLKDGWYATGDIATIDEEGFVEITDRAARFSKIGGEMVPHAAVEERLLEAAGSGDPHFVVTSAPDEKRGERLVVFYAGYEGSVEELWRKLNASGLPKLWIPARSDFIRLESLPLLGSGKLDLAGLKARAGRRAAEGGAA